MKARCGFVSNSSSSSFLLCGISNESLIKDILVSRNILDTSTLDRELDNHFPDTATKQKLVDETGLELYIDEDRIPHLGCKVEWDGLSLADLKPLLANVEKQLSNVDASNIYIEIIEEEW